MDANNVRSARSYLRRYWFSPRRVRFWLAAIAILYAVVGFLVLPAVAKGLAERTVRDDLGRDLRIESVHTNPFTLTAEIKDLALDDVDGRELLAFDRLFIDVAWSSLIEWTAVVPTVRLEGARVRDEQFAAGGTRLSRLLAEFGRRPLPRAGPRQGIIRPVQTGPTAPIAVSDIAFALDDFILAEGAASPVRLSARAELGGELAFDGELQIQPAFDLGGRLDVDGLAVALAEPFAQRFAHVRVDSGRLSGAGDLHTGPDDALTYAGSARLDELNIVERGNGEEVVGWQALSIDEIDFGLGARSLETSVIRIEQPTGRIFIAEDRSTNLGGLLVDRPAPEEPATADEAEPFAMMIGGVAVEGGSIAFADLSVPLPFTTRVHKLNGSVSRLEAGQTEPSRVELEGQVGEYGEARINGELNPWNPVRNTKLDVVFENLDIPAFTPYAIPFAGRRIADGRMDLDLVYSIDEGRLEASNSVVLHDLQLGERIEHPDATSLPLGLAIALLKDSDGVINVDIPITGNLQDPEFAVGPIIRAALVDMLASIVSSPFSFLAGLVGGDAEALGTVEFAPGTMAIEPAQRERLDQLHKALNERPELALEVAGPYAPAADRPVLQRKQALALMRERLEEADIDVASPELTAAETSATLEALYIEHYPQAALSEVRDRFTTDAGSSDTEFDAAGYREHLAAAVTQAQVITVDDLEALAEARAKAVRAFILKGDTDTTIASDRVRRTGTISVEADSTVTLEIDVAAAD